MFASVIVQAGKSAQFLTVPKTSVTYNPYGETVFVVQESGKGADGRPMLVARQVFVTTGASRGDQVAILKGVKEGDNDRHQRPDETEKRQSGRHQQQNHPEQR